MRGGEAEESDRSGEKEKMKEGKRDQKVDVKDW